MIIAGCSGWSYTDWVDRFYPRELAQRHSDWLRYYASYFGTTEVNSTFYSLPPRGMVDAWIVKTRDAGKFEFSLKLPRTITHEKLPAGDFEGIAADYSAFRSNCMLPLKEAGRLGAVLVQLPPQLGYSSENMNALGRALETLSDDSVQFAVEFRHMGWTEKGRGELRREALELLGTMGFSAVIVDSPAFPTTSKLTASHAYVRFHGRNSDIWYSGADEEDMRINRYDYLYSRGQLEEWVPRLRTIEGMTDITRVYFNNHGRAKAAKNAMELMDILGIEHQHKEIRIMDQSRLGSFVD